MDYGMVTINNLMAYLTDDKTRDERIDPLCEKALFGLRNKLKKEKKNDPGSD